MKSTMFTGLLLFLVGCALSQQKSTELEASDFEKQITAGNTQLLDVRTAGEYRSGHIRGALQADWNNKNQFADRTQYIDKSRPVYVYCLSGGRSAAAAAWLRKNGFKDVWELKGGILQWKSLQKPLEGNSSVPQMTASEYQSLVNSQPVVLVDFGAEWCPPCKKMEPVLNTLQQEYGNKFKLVKVDGGNDADIMKANNVEALPVFILYKNGKAVWRKEGIASKEELQQQILSHSR